MDLSDFLSTPSSKGKKTMLVLGTYAADFNAIEYAQRLRYYMPKLQERGITKIGLVLNCEAESAKALVDMVDLPCDSSEGYGVTLMVDPLGEAGRAFGVGTGWRPDDKEMSPYVKLFGMLFGLGAWATLPAVIGGYIGNPFKPQDWIEDALACGQTKGRWPDTALVLDESDGSVITNKFTELPVVGEWPRRPLELATLRLQSEYFMTFYTYHLTYVCLSQDKDLFFYSDSSDTPKICWIYPSRIGKSWRRMKQH